MLRFRSLEITRRVELLKILGIRSLFVDFVAEVCLLPSSFLVIHLAKGSKPRIELMWINLNCIQNLGILLHLSIRQAMQPTTIGKEWKIWLETGMQPA